MKKIKVAIIFGGRSAEHEVSIRSAKNVYDSLDKDKYEIILIGIDKRGRWFLNDTSLMELPKPDEQKLSGGEKEVTIVSQNQNNQLFDLSKKQNSGSVDVVFPVL